MPVIVDGNEIILSGTVGDLYWLGSFESFNQVDVIMALAEIGRDRDIVVRVNSPGGIATEGAAIYSTLVAHRGRKTVIIEGVAASAASIIAMAGDDIAMSLGSYMMVHDPEGWTQGNITEHEAQIRSLNVIGNTMAEVYAEQTGKSAEECRSDMRSELWMTPEEAVEKGYADRVQGKKGADTEPTAFNYRLYQNSPERLVALADQRAWTKRAPLAASAASPRHKEKPMATEKAAPAADPKTTAPATDPATNPSPAPAATTAADTTAAEQRGYERALAYIGEVNDLCALAGQPSKAQAFIDAKTSVADVRKQLLTERASASDANPTHNAIPPRTAVNGALPKGALSASMAKLVGKEV